VRTSRIRSCRQAGRGEKAVFLNRSLPVEEEPVSATTAWRGADMLRISIRPDADGPTLRTAARLHRTGRSCTELGGAAQSWAELHRAGRSCTELGGAAQSWAELGGAVGSSNSFE